MQDGNTEAIETITECDAAGTDSRRDRARAPPGEGESDERSARSSRRGSVRGRGGRRRRLPRPVSDHAGLRADHPPRARGREAGGADLRRRPEPEQTPRLLDLLDRWGAKATFFLIGEWAEREPELIRETVARGHAIGNHTYTHPTMPAHGAGRIREELRRCREAVEASGETFSTVDGAALMRPPYGRRRPGTLRTMREEGYVPVTWSITCYDWRAHTTTRAIPRRGKRARSDIILLHDGSAARPPPTATSRSRARGDPRAPRRPRDTAS